MNKDIYAVCIHEFGGPEILQYEEIPIPQPQEKEVLVRVHSAGVNPVDWKTRSGRGVASFLKDPFPLILGWDISGVVEKIGKAVTLFRTGDEVFGMIGFPNPGRGYAEFVCAGETEVVRKPPSIDHLHSASLPLVSLTAWQALFEAAHLEKGHSVLIHAAAGGVGHIAVQLAKWKGARVTGTASGKNEGFLRDIGIDEFIDYQSVNFEDIVRDVDVVLDTMSGQTRERSWKVLKKGGILVSILRPSPVEVAAKYGVAGKHILVRRNREQLARITELVAKGLIRPYVDRVFSLKEARKAHELSERGHTRGKIVLQVLQVY